MGCFVTPINGLVVEGASKKFFLGFLFLLLFFFRFCLLFRAPQPAEYGAEELRSLDAVPTLGLVGT